MELNEKIIELLKSSEALKSGEIAEKLSVDKTDVDKVLKKLKSEGKILSPKRCYYSIEK